MESRAACSSDCSVENAIDLVGGKWKLRILRRLLLEGPTGFNQLAARLDGISNKVLTQNLRALRASGVIEGGTDADRRYAVTVSGERLMPILHTLGGWAEQHLAEPAQV